MKKVVIGSIFGLLLGGCETATQVHSASTQGAAGLSCAQIYSTFDAYKRDKQSVEALRALGSIKGLDTSQATKENAATYYASAVASANIALLVQGCTPLP